MQYLEISEDRFIAAYNDFRFIPHIDILAPDSKNPLEYLSWSTAYKLLKELYPELVIEFERKESGSFVFEENNHLIKESAREDFLNIIEERKEQLKNTTDWKEKKALPKEIAECYAQLHYDNRGLYVLPYLVDVKSGLRTPVLYFPVMNNLNDSIYNPDSTDINTAKARGGVKAIAIYTGIGFRIYTREDIPDKTLAKDSPKWKRIKSILDSLEVLEREVDFSLVNLGRTEKQLEQLAYDLYFESEPIREAKKVKK